MGKEKYKLSPKTCKKCSEPISYEKRRNKFCSRSCSASFNNKGVRRHGVSPENINCHHCGKEIEEKRNGKKYCSVKCRTDYRYIQYIGNWKKGLENGIIGINGGISVHIRRYLFKKYDNKCAECGWCKVNQYTGKIPLQIDHIDGNSENNIEDNLTLICASCHSLTPTYGSLNNGNGRKNRYKNK